MSSTRNLSKEINNEDYIEEDYEDPYLDRLYANLIDPSTVTYAGANPNDELLKEEEKLFSPFIVDRALDLAKYHSLVKTLTTRQAQYELDVSIGNLPKNTAKSTVALYDSCKTDEQRRAIVEIASSHLNKAEKIAELNGNISELIDLFPLHLASNAAQSGKRSILFTQTHAMNLLNTEIVRHRMRFSFNQLQRDQKKVKLRSKEAEKGEQPLLTIESLSKKIQSLEKKLKNSTPKKDATKLKLKKKVKKVNSFHAKPAQKTKPPNLKTKTRAQPSTSKVRKGKDNIKQTLTINRSSYKYSAATQTVSPMSDRCLPVLVNKYYTNLTYDNLNEFTTLLSYGLKYIPQPPTGVSSSTFISLFDSMLDKIKWKYYFSYLTESTSIRSYNSNLKLPTTPFPDTKMDSYLRTRTNLIKIEFHKLLNANLKVKGICYEHPLVYKIRNLKTTLPSTKIIAADKNLGLVAMNTIDYHSLVVKHLSDELIYLNLGPIEGTQDYLASIIDVSFAEMLLISKNLSLSKQELQFVNDKRAKLPAFHVIAKIHKTPLSGRPIVGATDWVTTRFSILLDIRLQTYLPRFKSILKNSDDLIKKWHHQPFNPKNEWLISLDVSSLYTNIIVDTAIQLVSNYSPTLGTLAKLVMNNNYFEYNNELYHQKEGIAMGTNCAVSIANLYMAELIDLRLENLPSIRCYNRFIDDICFIFKGTEIELKILINDVNNFYPKLHFTSVVSKVELDVLDLTFYFKEGRLEHKIYQKLMNNYLYIPPFSNHPPATIRGFIKGELLRYQRSNSEYSNCLAIKKLFYKRLLVRGYSKTYLNSIFNLQSLTLSTKRLSPLEDIIVALPYVKSTMINKVKQFLTQQYLLIEPIKSIRSVWSTTPSLRKLLLQSKLSKEQMDYLKNNFKS